MRLIHDSDVKVSFIFSRRKRQQTAMRICWIISKEQMQTISVSKIKYWTCQLTPWAWQVDPVCCATTEIVCFNYLIGKINSNSRPPSLIAPGILRNSHSLFYHWCANETATTCGLRRLAGSFQPSHARLLQ